MTVSKSVTSDIANVDCSLCQKQNGDCNQDAYYSPVTQHIRLTNLFDEGMPYVHIAGQYPQRYKRDLTSSDIHQEANHALVQWHMGQFSEVTDMYSKLYSDVAKATQDLHNNDPHFAEDLSAIRADLVNLANHRGNARDQAQKLVASLSTKVAPADLDQVKAQVASILDQIHATDPKITLGPLEGNSNAVQFLYQHFPQSRSG